jgi:hypothetical protein
MDYKQQSKTSVELSTVALNQHPIMVELIRLCCFLPQQLSCMFQKN